MPLVITTEAKKEKKKNHKILELRTSESFTSSVTMIELNVEMTDRGIPVDVTKCLNTG